MTDGNAIIVATKHSADSTSLYKIVNQPNSIFDSVSCLRGSRSDIMNCEIHKVRSVLKEAPLILRFTDNPQNGHYAGKVLRTGDVVSIHQAHEVQGNRPLPYINQSIEMDAYGNSYDGFY